MKRSKYIQSLTFDWPAKVFSLVLAVVIYLFVSFTTIGNRVVTIPLVVEAPVAYRADSLVPESVEVQIKGDDDIIYLIDPDSIEASIDFSFVGEEGIASAPVLLAYEEDVFNTADVSVSVDPSYVRVLFAPEEDADQ